MNLSVDRQKNSKKSFGINGFSLKMIAVLLMLTDHVGAVIVIRLCLACKRNGLDLVSDGIYNFYASGGLGSLYLILREIGRLAFPIFCFMVAQGFEKTKNIRNYIIRMLIFSIVSEIPFDLAFSSKYFNLSGQNVGFTFLIGLLVLYIQSKIVNWNLKMGEESGMIKVLLIITVLLAGAFLAQIANTDYGAFGIILLDAFYIFRNNRKLLLPGGLVIILCYSLCVSGIEIFAALSLLILGIYNGNRGRKCKYFFYIFYPLHLVLLYFTCYLLGISQIIPG